MHLPQVKVLQNSSYSVRRHLEPKARDSVTPRLKSMSFKEFASAMDAHDPATADDPPYILDHEASVKVVEGAFEHPAVFARPRFSNSLKVVWLLSILY